VVSGTYMIKTQLKLRFLVFLKL